MRPTQRMVYGDQHMKAMPVNLYPFQEKFLSDNPNKALLAYETGCGKTLTAILWMKKRPVKHLIIVPKNIKGKWQRDMLLHPDINCEVITKEDFKKYDSKDIPSLVVDEADFFGSALFIKGRSKLAEKLYNVIKVNNPFTLLLTATPYRNAPHTIHTLLCYIHEAPAWKTWQGMCYELKMLPYLPRPAYIPTKEWRKVALVYSLPRIYTARISEIATIPTQHKGIVKIKTTPLSPLDAVSDTAVGVWHEKARAESGKEKLEWIKEYVKGHNKTVIVCRYKEQIAYYASELEKYREVFTLTGDVNDQDSVIEDAKRAFECVLIIQASIGAGFQLAEATEKGYYNFSHMIFASMSFSHRDYIQMQGRILRGDALQENFYTFLLGGPCDKSVYDRVMLGEDFTI